MSNNKKGDKTMNLIPKICEMLGVEIGEEFKLKQTNGDIKSAKYRLHKYEIYEKLTGKKWGGE